MNNHSPPKHGTPWNREESVLAFDLYCRIPFNKARHSTPEVKELAELLGRSPSSVARKLGNFGAFDPALHKRGVTGLVHTSKLDRRVWEEFHHDWGNLVVEAAMLRAQIGGDNEKPSSTEPLFTEESLAIPTGPSERSIETTARAHQAFFRQAVLSSYSTSCCITGLQIAECLIASHIVPWSNSEELRADPCNGLCLSATFDRLFDRGLLTVTPDFRARVAPSLLASPDEATKELILPFHNRPIHLPHRFRPSAQHLAWHRDNVFGRS